MDPKILESIGLTAGETKVYLALLRLGETKTGPLAKESKVSSSKVYKVLDRLMNKGLVGHVTKGKVKYFTAVEPERILEYMDKKEEELLEKRRTVEKLIPQLKLEQQLASKPNAVIYDGPQAIKNFFLNILTDLKKGEEYYVIGATYGELHSLRPFYQNFHTQRAKKGIKVKMLASPDTKGNLVKATKKVSNVKYLPQEFLSNMQLTFYKDKVLIMIAKKNPVGFLLYDKEAVKGFKTYFNTLWRIAKPST
jgi:sugar-specific transcriptional regulator TrmB